MKFPHKGHFTSKLNSKTVPVLPSFNSSLLFPFHLLPYPMHLTGFSLYIFPGFLAIFILLSSIYKVQEVQKVYDNCKGPMFLCRSNQHKYIMFEYIEDTWKDISISWLYCLQLWHWNHFPSLLSYLANVSTCIINKHYILFTNDKLVLLRTRSYQ